MDAIAVERDETLEGKTKMVSDLSDLHYWFGHQLSLEFPQYCPFLPEAKMKVLL